MRGRSLHVFCATTFAATAILFVLAASAAAAPIVDHSHFTSNETFPDNRCGIDVMIADSFMVNTQVFGETIKLEVKETQLITSTATGKAVEQFAAEQQTNILQPIDNGDGTTSLLFQFTGLEERLKIPNGPMLVRDAGPISFRLTFDADGNFLSIASSNQKGPHPLADSNFDLECDEIVSTLS
jgi:hypothetical protein